MQAPIEKPFHNNPMNARCGEKGCDCGYVIEKLVEVAESARDRLGPEDSLWSELETTIEEAKRK